MTEEAHTHSIVALRCEWFSISLKNLLFYFQLKYARKKHLVTFRTERIPWEQAVSLLYNLVPRGVNSLRRGKRLKGWIVIQF